jgi:hypothetical protein
MFGACLDEPAEECEKDIFGACIEEEPEAEVAEEETTCNGTLDIFGNCIEDVVAPVEEEQIDGECNGTIDIFGNCIEDETAECNGTVDIFGNCIEDVVEEPVIEEPVIEEPIVDEPIIEEPVDVEEPVIEEPAIEEPAVPLSHDDHFTNVISTATVDRQFKFEGEPMTFIEAQANCEAWGGNLASIHDVDENNYILENLPMDSAGYWMGLNTLETYTAWNDGSAVDFSMIPSGVDPRDHECFLVGSQWDSVSCDELHFSVCKKDSVVESHEATDTVLDGMISDTPMPVVETCTDECVPPVDNPEDPVEESSCDEIEFEAADGACHLREECGRDDYLDETTQRWVATVTYCAPRCPDPLNIWNEDLQICEPIIPPLTCEEKLAPHIDRETEVQERYFLQ